MPTDPSANVDLDASRPWTMIVGVMLVLLAGVYWFAFAKRDKHAAAIEPEAALRLETEPSRSVDLAAPMAGKAEGIAGERALAADPVTSNTDAAAPADSLFAPLRIRLLDRATLEPLPAFGLGCQVEVRGIPDPQPETDANGEVRWSLVRSPSDAHFSLFDHSGIPRKHSPQWQSIRFDPESGDLARQTTHEVLVDCGPTLFMEVKMPGGYEPQDLNVSLNTGLIHASGWVPEPTHMASLRKPNAATRYPELHWVRFGSPIDIQDLVWVEVRTSDAKYRGGAWVSGLRGVCTTPLQIGLQLGTTLAGQFRFGSGTDQDWATFRLVEVVAKETTVPARDYRTTIIEDGRFLFHCVEPGRYELRVSDKNWQPVTIPVVVSAGQNDMGTIPLVARRIVGDIRGQIESTSGTYKGGCHVSLSEIPFDHNAPYNLSIDFVDDGTGRLIAPFHFEAVTEGPWNLFVHCHDTFQWDSVQVVQAPADELRIVLDDRVAEIEIHVLDEATGKPMGDEVSIQWKCHEEQRKVGGSHLLVTVQDAPERFAYLVFAAGYQPQHGTAATFHRIPAKVGGVDRLEGTIMLRRGWGAKLRTYDRTRGGAIPGVRVLVDSEYVGDTDSEGVYWLMREEAPTTIHMEKSGWQWVTNRDANARKGTYREGPVVPFALEQL